MSTHSDSTITLATFNAGNSAATMFGILESDATQAAPAAPLPALYIKVTTEQLLALTSEELQSTSGVITIYEDNTAALTSGTDMADHVDHLRRTQPVRGLGYAHGIMEVGIGEKERKEEEGKTAKMEREKAKKEAKKEAAKQTKKAKKAAARRRKGFGAILAGLEAEKEAQMECAE